MFSKAQKQKIAQAVEEILLSFDHPEMLIENPKFTLRVEGKESWSFAVIEPNWTYKDTDPGVNLWNEQNSQPKGEKHNV